MKYLMLFSTLFMFSCLSTSEFQKVQKQKENYAKVADSLKTLSLVQNARIETYLEKISKLDFIGKEYEKIHAIIHTTVGDIEVKFYPKFAPLHVLNFVKLAEGGFYNGTFFHRVIPGFMIQGGDPNTKNSEDYKNHGTGGSLGKIPSEFTTIAHERGVLSMARTSDPNSARSQFFIMHKYNKHLDGKYSVFGKVVKGIEIVDKIATNEYMTMKDFKEKGAKLARIIRNYPKNPVKIISIKLKKVN
jgi:peptidyl-prolyl cis-trans isomerase B (cyclophilin B)